MRLNYKVALLIIAFSIPLGAMAQWNYKPGFIVTNENDTIVGKIYDGGSAQDAKVCKFIAEGSNEATKYYPNDIKAFRVYDGKYYKTKEIFSKGEYGPVFLDVLLEGDLNLYYDRTNRNQGYYIEQEEDVLVGLAREVTQVRQSTNDNLESAYEGNKYFVEFETYKDTLQSLFADNKKVQSQVANVNYDKKSLINITKAYLNETSVGDDYITYEKNLRESKATYGLFMGVQMSQIEILKSTWSTDDAPVGNPEIINSEDHNLKSSLITSIPIGAFYNIPLSFLSNQLSFQAEFVTSKLRYTERLDDVRLNGEENYNNFDITSRRINLPLMLKYELPGKTVSPSVAFGHELSFLVFSDIIINDANGSPNRDYYIHSNQKGGWFADLGLTYKLSPKLSLFSNVRFKYTKNLIVKDFNRGIDYSTIEDKLYYKYLYQQNFATLYLGVKF